MYCISDAHTIMFNFVTVVFPFLGNKSDSNGTFSSHRQKVKNTKPLVIWAHLCIVRYTNSLDVNVWFAAAGSGILKSAKEISDT